MEHTFTFMYTVKSKEELSSDYDGDLNDVTYIKEIVNTPYQPFLGLTVQTGFQNTKEVILFEERDETVCVCEDPVYPIVALRKRQERIESGLKEYGWSVLSKL